MALPSSGELPLANDHDIVLCRQHVRRLSQEVNFSLVDQTKFVTAASELARNAVIYGGGGRMLWRVVENGSRRGVCLSFIDEGPGIPNLELAMSNGWSSGSGLGMGLSGAKRLVNEFHIQSSPGSGTRVTITRWR
ncbi:MAG TPA: ATP-binding protein [Steroidobacteraceae bacterium]|jgi:serine/threonine-protein kinase RsbT